MLRCVLNVFHAPLANRLPSFVDRVYAHGPFEQMDPNNETGHQLQAIGEQTRSNGRYYRARGAVTESGLDLDEHRPEFDGKSCAQMQGLWSCLDEL